MPPVNDAAPAPAAPVAPGLEEASCPACSARESDPFVTAEDDLGGKPGRFTFVRCRPCGLVYQSPRIPFEGIAEWYDGEYISHRKRTSWGPLTWFYEWAMSSHDRRKVALVGRSVKLDATSEVLDVGCGSATFLALLRARHGSRVTGVDFKDLSHLPWWKEIDFKIGAFGRVPLPEKRYDLVTMWHFLEHSYDPLAALAEARRVVKPGGRIVIEVPRLDSVTAWLYGDRWPGLQAPQHTVLFSKASLLDTVRRSGLTVEEYLPWGAFPPYFYVFAGAAFKLLRGRGLPLGKAIYPYFVGQILLTPVLLFERRLNLAMQTVVLRP